MPHTGQRRRLAVIFMPHHHSSDYAAAPRHYASRHGVAGSCCIVFVVRDPGRVPSSCLLVRNHEKTLAHLRLRAGVQVARNKH
jgi:hypothetical protein